MFKISKLVILVSNIIYISDIADIKVLKYLYQYTNH